MEERTYTINELRTLINESSSDFKAKVADGVNSTNKKENEKTYKDAKQKVKSFDGGGDELKQERKVYDKIDGNKTTLDYSIDGELSDKQKDTIKAQAEGYTSTLEKNNGIEKSAEFSDASYKQFKKAGKEMAKNKVDAKKAGLTARELPKSAFEKEDLYKESKKISVLNFKNTTFINESHMISRIPDDYKTEGNRFKVKDAGSNEFIVEWKEGEANILSYENKKKLNESIEKFHKLTGYSSKEQFKNSTSKSRLNEGNEFNNILNKTRELIKKKEE
jgi:hypothetical protein